jgi:DegV family protein with EDD domain
MRDLLRRFRRRPAVRVVTDSTADLPPALAEELDIEVVPLLVIFGEEQFLDGVNLSSEEFFERLERSSTPPHTSQPPPAAFQEVYEQLARKTDRIVSIHLSGKLSGTLDSARTGAQGLGQSCRVELVDSRSVSMGLGMAVLAAARAAREGADLEEAAQAARSVSDRLRIAVVLDTLEYLRRGGRIGRAQSLLGSLLHIKPILTLQDGEAHPLARARTREKALERVYELAISERDIQEVAVMQATTPEDAERLAARVVAERPHIPVHVGRLGPVIAVHGGPGIVGMAAVEEEKDLE